MWSEEGASVAGERRFADAESLRPAVRAVFGRNRELLSVVRLAGGSKKGAYRLTMDDGGMVLLYAWNDSEDYWQGALSEGADDPADSFSHPSGLTPFETAARRLASAGVRCPEILFADRSRALYPADIAVVEEVVGASLETLLETDPVAAGCPLAVLADWRCLPTGWPPWLPSGPRHFGKVAFVDAGGRSRGTSCEAVMLDRASRALGDRRARPASRCRPGSAHRNAALAGRADRGPP